MKVEETPLPGIGVRKDIVTASGRRIGTVIQRDGETELIVSRADDPDACIASIPLTAEEAFALGNPAGSAPAGGPAGGGASGPGRSKHPPDSH